MTAAQIRFLVCRSLALTPVQTKWFDSGLATEGDSLRCGFGSIWITDYKKGMLSRIPVEQVLK